MENHLGLIEMSCVLGFALVWVVWELVSVYRVDSDKERGTDAPLKNADVTGKRSQDDQERR